MFEIISSFLDYSKFQFNFLSFGKNQMHGFWAWKKHVPLVYFPAWKKWILCLWPLFSFFKKWIGVHWQWLTHGGGMKNGQKNFKNSIFSKVLKLFTHGMGCFGTGLGMLFHLYKGLDVTHELFKKIEKNSSKIAVLACGGPPYWVWAGKQQFLSYFFFRFS